MMALGHKVFGAGLSGLAVAALCNDAATGLTATGTNQATAYSMTAADNEFTTVDSGTGAVLYAGSAGDEQTVFNAGSNPLTVYPDSGAKINNLPTNQGVLIPTNTGCIFKRLSTTRIMGILSR